MSYYPKPFDNFDGYSVDDGTLNKSQSETGINNPCFDNGPDPPPDTNKKLPPPNKVITTLNKHKSQQLHEISVINNDILSSCGDPKKKDPQLWRDLVAYWILGLCNNYGFIVMLSAANDMLEGFYETDQIGIDKTTTNDSTVKLNTERSCTLASTGTILLADIIPGLIIKLIAPFLPFWINVRVFFAVAMSAGGFLFVGLAKNEFMAIFGVILTSASSCLGETTFLAYSSKYNKNVVSTWSSGTGGAGITGSLSYAALKSLNIDQTTTMLIMLVIPALECFTFWILLRPPASNVLPQTIDESDQQNNRIETTTTRQCNNDDELNDDEKPLVGFVEKLLYCGPLLKYMVPLMAVYIAQYFINQGLFQLVYFENTFLDQASQYRWLTVDFQLGVFISKSTVNLYSVDRIWLMSLFQFINVLYFLIEVVFYITPSIWITFVIVLWEGLLGGSVYSHTFFKISKEITALRKRFAMGIGALGVSAGIAIAGFAAIPAHNAICALSLSTRRFYWW